MRAWQKMLSGRRLDLNNPSAMDIEIEDIAHGLSRVARWNGQTSGDYAFSVAQHLSLAEDIARTLQPNADRSWLMATLLHDAPEYVTGGIISPFKHALGLDYKMFENNFMQAAHVRFGLPAVVTPQMEKFIARADKAATYLEATQIAGFTEAEASKLFGPPPVTVKNWEVVPVTSKIAKDIYLARFEELQTEIFETAAA